MLYTCYIYMCWLHVIPYRTKFGRGKIWTDKNMDRQKDGHICHPKKHVFLANLYHFRRFYIHVILHVIYVLYNTYICIRVTYIRVILLYILYKASSYMFVCMFVCMWPFSAWHHLIIISKRVRDTTKYLWSWHHISTSAVSAYLWYSCLEVLTPLIWVHV